MIATLLMAALAPLDYRSALDAARSLFGSLATPVVRCNLPELTGEANQRFSGASASIDHGALWIEPMVSSWRVELTELAADLPLGARLVVIVSQPLARIVPERRTWSGQPLGMRLLGSSGLLQAMRAADLKLEARYGFHTPASIGLSQLSSHAARLGHPDLGDRLHFAARLRYCSRGWLAALATVGLVVGRKQG